MFDSLLSLANAHHYMFTAVLDDCLRTAYSSFPFFPASLRYGRLARSAAVAHAQELAEGYLCFHPVHQPEGAIPTQVMSGRGTCPQIQHHTPCISLWYREKSCMDGAEKAFPNRGLGCARESTKGKSKPKLQSRQDMDKAQEALDQSAALGERVLA